MDSSESVLKLELEPLPASPRVSVVITTYDEEIYDDFATCVDSVLNQTYENVEVVIVTETKHASDRVSERFADLSAVTHVHVERSLNLASARNLGAERASGDVYAFIDDDAIADPKWIARIVDTYETEESLAVGGKLTARWPTTEPAYLPSEFYWLVGVTHSGFREDAGPVRNTFGANISFRSEVFDALGGFNSEFGKDHGHNLQGEETELAARMYDRYGGQVYYTPSASVEHRVYEWQLTWRWLINRAYWQGFTKELLEQSVPNSTEAETRFLRMLVVQSMPKYFRQTISTRSHIPVFRCMFLVILSLTVALGYISAKSRSLRS